MQTKFLKSLILFGGEHVETHLFSYKNRFRQLVQLFSLIPLHVLQV